MSKNIEFASALAAQYRQLLNHDRIKFPEHIWSIKNGPIDGPSAEARMRLEKAIWNYLVTRRLRSMTKKDFDEARTQLDDFGLTEDLDQVQPGDTQVLYRGSVIQLQASAIRGSEYIDVGVLIEELRKAGIREEFIQQAVKMSTKEREPSRTLETVILV